MYRFLLRPAWLLFHAVVLAGVILMVTAGFWQLDRLDERKDFNSEVRERSQRTPLELTGVLDVLDALAGCARRVGVSTHDPTQADEAIRRFQKAGTPCDLELLHGLPMRDAVGRARDLGVPVRIYVPYGEAYMPYALSQARRKPRIVWWLLKDVTVSMFDRWGTASSQAPPVTET